jgi:transposase
MDAEERVRRQAVRRVLGGERAVEVAKGFGRSERWIFKWLHAGAAMRASSSIRSPKPSTSIPASSHLRSRLRSGGRSSPPY